MKNFLLIFKIILLTFLLFKSTNSFSKNFIINGNVNSDDSVILSIIGSIPKNDNSSQSNYILKKLNESELFKSVNISFDENNFYINIEEYSSINKIYYEKNNFYIITNLSIF